MGTQFLIDTSAAIKFLSQAFPFAGTAFMENFIDADCTLSFITEIELQAWSPANPANIVVYQQFVAGELLSTLMRQSLQKPSPSERIIG